MANIFWQPGHKGKKNENLMQIPQLCLKKNEIHSEYENTWTTHQLSTNQIPG
jgi:hypothetical protein